MRKQPACTGLLKPLAYILTLPHSGSVLMCERNYFRLFSARTQLSTKETG